MVRAHFVDIKSHIVSLLVARCPAWEQAQDQEAEHCHRPPVAARELSSSTACNTCSRDEQFVCMCWKSLPSSTPFLTLRPPFHSFGVLTSVKTISNKQETLETAFNSSQGLLYWEMLLSIKCVCARVGVYVCVCCGFQAISSDSLGGMQIQFHTALKNTSSGLFINRQWNFKWKTSCYGKGKALELLYSKCMN